MALSYEQRPIDVNQKVPAITEWTPLIGVMLYQSSVVGYFYHKLIVEVKLGTTIIGKIKQRRNGYDDDITNNRARAFFDITDIANSVLIDTMWDQNLSGSPFGSIHFLGANDTSKIFSNNGDYKKGYHQIARLEHKGYEEYSSSESASPIEYPATSVSYTCNYMRASLPLHTPRNTNTDFVQSAAFNVFTADTTTDFFLTDAKPVARAEYGLTNVIRTYIKQGQSHTIAFLNNYDYFGSDVKQVEVTYYDATGAVLQTGTIANTAAALAGGIDPTTAGLTEKESLLYFGCGTFQLKVTDYTAIANVNTAAYYKVELQSAAGNPRSRPIYFINQENLCDAANNKYPTVRLAWINSKGCYDYWNFSYKSIKSIDVKRNQYSSVIGRHDGSKYTYNNSDSPRITRDVTATRKMVINSGFIEPEDVALMESLIMSRGVWAMEEQAEIKSVSIKETSITKKTNINDRLKIMYTFTIEFTNELNQASETI